MEGNGSSHLTSESSKILTIHSEERKCVYMAMKENRFHDEIATMETMTKFERQKFIH